MTEIDAEKRFVSRYMANEDLYFYSRYMFLRRKNFKWLKNHHHRVMCDALMRVYRGECKRLIINVPPRYSKTELAVVNFITWCLGKVPDAEFIHTSYSTRLAVNNSWQARELLTTEAYQDVFRARLNEDSKAKDEWRTTAGGVLYATGAGGTITGYGAGKQREGFSGCFPIGTKVWTETGLLPIDRIVRERMAINVWSFDYTGRMVLRPVTAWHENPPNEIVRITFDDGATVECTPDHRFWTDNRGWVRADSLSVEDRLPSVQRGIERANNISVDTQRNSGRVDSFPVFASGSNCAVSNGNIGLVPGQLGAKVGFLPAFSDNINATSNRLPCVASPYLENYCGADAVRVGKVFGGNSDRVIDRHGLFVRENGARVSLGFTESAMPLTINDIGGAGVVPEIAQPVVASVSVSMAHIGAIGLGTNKGQHDQLVNIENLGLGIPGQVDAEVTLAVVAGLEDSFGLDVFRPGARNDAALASDAPQVTDRVEPFISGHRKPVLVEHVRHDDVTFCLTVDEYHNFTIESGLVVKNCIVIDDPHKPDEATSEVMRANVIDWFQNTLESRLNSRETPIILIMQRLHENDLAGWLLAGGNGEPWEHVCLPAIQPDGTALWAAKHSIEDLRRMEAASPYVFAGQYMQSPAPLQGGLFKPDQIQIIDALPAENIQWVRGWDLASTTDGDWTAGVKLGRLPNDRFVIGNCLRLRVGPDARDAAIINTASLDGRTVKISIPQDPGQAGKTQVLYLTRSLAGYRVTSSPESGDKVTRAEPVAAQVNIGNVMMLRGDWNQAMLDEMRMFPNGVNDDQIDGLSRAFGELITRRPMQINPSLLRRA